MTHEKPIRLSRRRFIVAGAAAASGIGAVALSRDDGSTSTSTGESTPEDNVESAGVRFTTTGSTFSPALEMEVGSTDRVVWLEEGGREIAEGTRPHIDFGSAGVRQVTLVTRFADVTTLNLGFDSHDDVGTYSLDATYDSPPQGVSALSGLTRLTRLRRLLAARGNLTGALDITGLAELEHVELYGAGIQSIRLTGCSSLIRLCLEQNDLRALDLNPVAASLRDLRVASAQARRALTLAPLQQSLSKLEHFCVGNQMVTGHPTPAQLPVCQEIWNFNSGQIGEFPTPPAVRSVRAADNLYETADFAGQWTYQGGYGLLDLSNNQLKSINITGCRALQSIWLRGNKLDQATVDRILLEVESWGTPGFHLWLDSRNSAPSLAGGAAAKALRDRGWDVTLSGEQAGGA